MTLQKGSPMPPAAVFRIGDAWAWFVRSDMTGRDDDDITYPFSDKAEAVSDLMVFVAESVDTEYLRDVLAAIGKEGPA